MAALGPLSFDFEDHPSSSAFGAWLNHEAAENIQYRSENGWVISTVKGQSIVVARTETIYTSDVIRLSAISAIEEALDLVCFRFNDPLQLNPEDDDSVTVETVDGRRVMTCKTVAPWAMRMGPLSLTVTDAAGNIVSPVSTKPKWQPVLRYYRLSQTRDNFFDAYRYMFLALEALLSSLWPMKTKPKEREVDWLLRAVGELSKRINLTRYVNCTTGDEIQAFVDTHYVQYRLPLFHSKKSSTTLPHEGLLESDLMNVYTQLTRLVRESLNVFFDLQGQSGVFTNYVFQSGINNFLETTGLYAAFTYVDGEHDVEKRIEQAEAKELIRFGKVESEPEGNLGHRRVIATKEMSRTCAKSEINHLGFIANDQWLITSTLDHSINLVGIDVFRFEVEFKMINLNAPKWA